MTAYQMLSMAEQLDRMDQALKRRAAGDGGHHGWTNKPASPVASTATEPPAEPVYACPHCRDLGVVAVEAPGNRYATRFCPYCSADRAAEAKVRATGLAGEARGWRLSGFRRRFGPAAAGLDAAREAVRHPAGFVTFHGGYGSGKSHLLAGVCNELRESGRTVHYTTLAGLLDYLRAAFDPERGPSYTARYERMLAVDALALDEVDKASMTQWADEKLFELLDNRYRRAAECLTLVATNQRLCDRDQAGRVTRTYSVLPQSRHAGAIMSRVLDGRFLVVDMGNEDVRPSLDRGKWLQGLAGRQ
jgi:DNA replication protein DnaC